MDKAPQIEDSGERMIPAAHKGHLIYGEHLSRYMSLEAVVAGKRVLDIACGSGYGTKIIADSAKEVIGVDISEEAVTYAQASFGAKNITYKVGDGAKIPLEDASVDVVASFETIEHIEAYKAFLSEVKRVLVKGGQFVVSTPNDHEYPKGNHFHVHEFELEELMTELGQYFKNIEVYYQGIWLFTGLFNRAEYEGEWARKLPVRKEVTESGDRALYYTLVCSDAKPAALTEVPIMSEPWYAKDQVDAANSHSNHIHELEQSIDELRQATERLTGERDVAQAQLEEIRQSHSWRWTSALRKAKNAVWPKK